MRKLSIAFAGLRTSHELSEERITIGRGPGNMIQIDDPSVSGRHAQLLLVDDRSQLTDLGSTNGTRVNSELVTEVFLRVGDRIRFGKVETRYESGATGQAKPLPEAGEIEARPGKTSARPTDFANASPFGNRKKEEDTVGRVIFVAAGVAILVFLLSMVGLLLMSGSMM
jgi:predicted component of type VI protein secretion system